MNPPLRLTHRFLPAFAILCCLLITVGVVWASDRGLEITDEAYYLLSAIHPDQIMLYISAQHWILAPLWRLSESLQGFRLTGASILICMAGVLGLGTVWILEQLTLQKFSPLETFGVMAAGATGALLYVATIAPSPSYNLLASAGAYGATGFALLAVKRRSLSISLMLCLFASMSLTVCFVNKPSAGVCSALLVSVFVLGLEPRRRKWLFALTGIIGTILTIALLVAVQPSELPVQVSLSKGLELFRQVQVEPVGVRLIRYAVTLAGSVWGALVSFWPGMLLMIVVLFYPRRWLYISMLCVLGLNIILEKNYSAGMLSYQRVTEGLYAIFLLLIVFGARVWSAGFKVALLFSGLFILPFSVAIGTGNSLFTQIIVTLAPWTIVATLLALMTEKDAVRHLLQQGLACLFLGLITAQIFSSYTREPYHLSEPLTGQTQSVAVGALGVLKVDTPTVQFLDDLRSAKNVCAIEPGAQFMGLFNVPGVALVFEAAPPVSPWLNNTLQAETVLGYWTPELADRVVLVLTSEVIADMSKIPDRLQPVKNGYKLCGKALIPVDGRQIEVWASPNKSPT